MKFPEFGIGALVGFVSGIIMVCWIMGGNTKYDERKRAIEAGVAEWRVDPKTGNTSFHYLTPSAK